MVTLHSVADMFLITGDFITAVSIIIITIISGGLISDS